MSQRRQLRRPKISSGRWLRKLLLLKALKKPVINVTQVGLVIGGGVSGMTAASELAKQGFEVHLVEKDKALGGQLRCNSLFARRKS